MVLWGLLVQQASLASQDQQELKVEMEFQVPPVLKDLKEKKETQEYLAYLVPQERMASM